jgi:hypothetical protein
MKAKSDARTARLQAKKDAIKANQTEPEAGAEPQAAEAEVLEAPALETDKEVKDKKKEKKTKTEDSK